MRAKSRESYLQYRRENDFNKMPAEMGGGAGGSIIG